jgi:hypothetical protein
MVFLHLSLGMNIVVDGVALLAQSIMIELPDPDRVASHLSPAPRPKQSLILTCGKRVVHTDFLVPIYFPTGVPIYGTPSQGIP